MEVNLLSTLYVFYIIGTDWKERVVVSRSGKRAATNAVKKYRESKDRPCYSSFLYTLTVDDLNLEDEE